MYRFRCSICNRYEQVADYMEYAPLFRLSEKPLCTYCFNSLKNITSNDSVPLFLEYREEKAKAKDIIEKVCNFEMSNIALLSISGYVKKYQEYAKDKARKYIELLEKHEMSLIVLALEREILLDKVKKRGFFTLRDLSCLSGVKISKIKEARDSSKMTIDYFDDYFLRYSNMKEVFYWAVKLKEKIGNKNGR